MSSTATARRLLADRKYLAREGANNFYSLYRCHNFHFKLYGAMFLGQLQPALEAADEMIATLPEELLRIESPPMADWLEGFVPMKLHVLIRFGRWIDIIAMPLPADRELFCVTTAMIHYAKAVAHAATWQRGGCGGRGSPLRWQPSRRCRLHATCSTTHAWTFWRSRQR